MIEIELRMMFDDCLLCLLKCHKYPTDAVLRLSGNRSGCKIKAGRGFGPCNKPPMLPLFWWPFAR